LAATGRDRTKALTGQRTPKLGAARASFPSCATAGIHRD